jgi:lipopolysaccharide/colanic/teichoic acid biosynthesis glycosyltransferase
MRKFRTLGATRKRVGRLLRRTSLVAIPELFNILSGGR